MLNREVRCCDVSHSGNLVRASLMRLYFCISNCLRAGDNSHSQPVGAEQRIQQVARLGTKGYKSHSFN